jgi:hypothetical protein
MIDVTNSLCNFFFFCMKSKIQNFVLLKILGIILLCFIYHDKNDITFSILYSKTTWNDLTVFENRINDVLMNNL